MQDPRCQPCLDHAPQEGFGYDSGGRGGMPEGAKGATAAELMLRHLSDPGQGLRERMRQSSGTGLDMRRCRQKGLEFKIG